MRILVKGICPLCPPNAGLRFLTAGLCGVHYWNANRLQSLEKCTTEKKTTIVRKQDWFTEQHELHPCYVCENCQQENLPIFNPSVTKSHHAHILPASLFPSVADDLSNHMMLCGYFTINSCHNIYDSSWTRAIRMPVFEIALERFTNFAHKLTAEEVNILPPIFLSKYNEIMPGNTDCGQSFLVNTPSTN